MQAAKLLLMLCLPLAVAQLKAANWLTFGNDPQRTSWSPQETDIHRDNAKSMTLLWKTHLENEPRELNGLTAAVVVEWVVTDQGMKEIAIVGGASDHLFAMDAGTGKVLWKKTFAVDVKPKQQPFWLCPNALNATPLIRKQGLAASVYTIASDGKLHVLNVIDGEDRMPPMQFVPPYSKNWSLNLVDYFTPTNHNYLTRKDLDMGSLSPTVFPLNGREIVAAGGKEGVVYLL